MKWLVRMQFQILGKLELVKEGESLVLGRRHLRVLLATLLSQANRPVTVAALTAALWTGDPPKSALKNLQGYVHQARQLIGEDRIVRHPHGYSIVVHPGELDADEFARLVDEAATVDDPTRTVTLLTEAERLWRGPAFADLADASALQASISALTDRRLSALEQRVQIDLSLGRHHEVGTELGSWVDQHPLREHLRGLLMVALHRSGRRAEALRVYQQGRTVLAEELGVDPSDELQEIQLAILRGGESGPAQVAEGGPAAKAPAQLPPAIPAFSGRTAQLAELDARLERSVLNGGTLLVSAIAGMGGVGKTALAVHWARRVSHRFPDGQLYATLNAQSGQPTPPQQVLEQFLRALGVPSGDIPGDTDAASSLFRTVLSGRQVLILLDNAVDADQVRPLLPASSGCLTLVTSRHRMSGLVARDGATRLDLDRLSLPEALTLLAELLGNARVEADPAAAAELARACGYMPLALRIVAAHLIGRPRMSLATIVAELRADPMGTLETDDDPQTSMHAVLSRSYRGLTPASQRALRLLAGIGWADFSLASAAAVLGMELAQARAMTATLGDVYLLERRAGRDRFGFHDLTQAYAMTLDDPELPQAQARLLEHFRHMSTLANSIITPGQQPPEGVDPTLTSPVEAMQWFDAERVNVIATILGNANSQLDSACALAMQMWPYLNETRRTNELIEVFDLLAKLSESKQDRPTWVQMLNALGGAYLAGGRYQEAIAIHRQCLELREELQDRIGVARSHANLGLLHERLGKYQTAITHYEQTLAITREVGDRELELKILAGGITGAYFRLGDYPKVLELLLSGLDGARAEGSQFTLAAMLTNLGETYRLLGQPQQALPYLEESLALSRSINLQSSVSHALGGIADIERDLGNFERAIELRLEANEMIAESALRGEYIEALLELGKTYTLADQPEQAQETYRKALALAVEVGEPHQEGKANLALGHLLSTSDTGQARQHLRAAADALEAIAPESAQEARALLKTL